MSIDVATIHQAKASSFGRVPAWSWLGTGVYVVLLVNGSGLLNDSDTFWQIAVGQWILDHGALPRVDVYSFSKFGEPWISSSWLAQILYAVSYNLAGWTGPVVVAAGSIAATFGLLAHILERRMRASYAALVALAAMVLSAPHFLARPHVLAMPVTVAWAHGLMTASERRQAPSFWLLPLIALWANLHGGFVFGLVLAGAFAIDAVWNAAPLQRKPLALRWVAFGLAALLACCFTPYGWESILASRKILDLGELLRLISEWAPADFSRISPFELTILALIAGTLYRGVTLSPPRIALVLGLLHMALSHGRNLEIFALLLPIVVLTPVSRQFALQPTWSGRMTLASAAVLAVTLSISTWAVAAYQAHSPPKSDSPAAAVEAIKAHNLRRVLNDRAFGGYLIWRQMPVFIDGRAELYGEKFTMAYYNALELKDVSRFLSLLKDHDIDALLLRPGAPAASLLDHVGVWRRVYADDVAVLYVRGGS
ncbi:hypothetical protein [Bradyrhizobium australiense]|uniref:Glycosyltransferase RgtA/B/C/D-like domain-containing protein n=1 Tax=Bradyrhizobium australiense TaxID=2721161 RepID=A0A7Y4GTJ4_9BRAD|nr:hypothetical protein [Bradyrhizobium australiense]NOJ41724.1 hypothetical protein [Bradyrhizobium australiense]